MKKVIVIAGLMLVSVFACQKDYYLEDLNEANAKIASLERELNNAETKINSLEGDNSVLRYDLSEIRDKLSAIQQQVVGQNEYIEELEVEIEDLEAKIEELENDCNFTNPNVRLHWSHGDLTFSYDITLNSNTETILRFRLEYQKGDGEWVEWEEGEINVKYYDLGTSFSSSVGSVNDYLGYFGPLDRLWRVTFLLNCQNKEIEILVTP